MSVWAIGDIHGCRTALETLLNSVPFGSNDTLVLLGDFIDRGPDTKGVLERIIRLCGETHTVCLLGNHEQMLQQARSGGSHKTDWLLSGGRETLTSYGGSMEKIPEAHWRFLDGCVNYYETDRFFFVHAGAYSDLFLPDQPEYVLRWQRWEKAAPHQSGKTMICGHTRQKSGVPANKGFAVCVDTGACGSGWLSCLQTETGRVYQANEQGETRQLWLDAI